MAARADKSDRVKGKRHRRVLVVDDERDVASSLADLLQVLGYRACCAYDGLQALTLALEFRPDTVFLDIGLPDMDGYEVLRRLRASFPRIRAVALSGDPSEERRGEATLFDVFILKPGSVQHIEHALESAP